MPIDALAWDAQFALEGVVFYRCTCAGDHHEWSEGGVIDDKWLVLSKRLVEESPRRVVLFEVKPIV
jgi:hypothetical protein